MFETNVDLNTEREANKYKEMLKSLENKFEKATFVNFKMGVLGIVRAHSNVSNMLKASTENRIFDLKDCVVV